jgi:hypothetical protein
MKTANEALQENSIVGDVLIPVGTLADVIDELSTVGENIARRAFANSALFQAIAAAGDWFILLSNPNHDEIKAKRLEQRAERNAQIYAYFATDLETFAESEYDKAMSVEDMFDFVLKAAPRKTDDADYSPEILEAIGITEAEARAADAEQLSRDLALFKTKVETLSTLRDAVVEYVKQTGGTACPELPVTTVYGMLVKCENKLGKAKQRLWANRNRFSGALAQMTLINDDIKKLNTSIKRMRREYAGDSRVNLDIA